MKIFTWINTNLLFLLSLLLLVFIPLFPKLPLLDVIPGYIVKIRIEDLLVLLTGVVWLRDVRSKRIEWRTSYFWFVVAYALVGIFSIILGVFLLRTIPLELLHIGKSGLHLFRYLEYFTVFFFLFSAVKTKKQVSMAIFTIALTLIGVVGYGVGQKMLHFPVYSTMNREYSKGEKLYLQEGARPQSTFAGHYDLAAYLVIILPLIFSLAISRMFLPFDWKKHLTGIGLLLVFIAGVFMLILSGSKTSIAAFGLGTVIVLFLHWLRIQSPKIRLILAFVAIVLSIFSGVLGWKLAPQSLKSQISSMLMRLQTGAKELPSDLVGDGYEEKTTSTVQPDGSVKRAKVRVKSVWSPNALKYGLSMGIRLDTLWPQALLGFARNPLTGSGYGTLAMLDSGLFQEADSTDNNYLRVLGETGILGFVTFYGLLLLILWETVGLVRNLKVSASLAIGLCGAVIGLMVTAVYLDVFAASKVAFVFWAVSGLVLKASRLDAPQELSAKRLLQPVAYVVLQVKRYWPLLAAITLAFFLLHQNPFMTHNPTKDIDGYTVGLEDITAARCFVTNRVFSLCRSSGLVFHPHLTLYSLLLVPWMSAFKISGVFYYLNLLLIIFGLSWGYILVRRSRPQTVFLSLLMGVCLAATSKLTSRPLNSVQFVFVLFCLPALIFVLTWWFTRTRFKKMISIFGLTTVVLVILISGRSLVTGELLTRFRQLSPNDAYITLQEANGLIESTPEAPAYLATTLNPYYADEYAMSKYSVLPLSSSQPYASYSDSVWGVPKLDLHKLYTSMLESSSQIFLSDYGVSSNALYRDSFSKIKDAFDLSYIHLGCEERCNLYSVNKAEPILSTNISTPFNGRVLRAQDFPTAYQFAVVSNRFDPTLSDIEFRTTAGFVDELKGLGELRQFLIFSGDVGEKPEGVYTKVFMDGFALKLETPILYSAGNADLIAEKDVDGGYKEFFTNREYFILMNVNDDSTLSIDQQLKLYNTLLRLEKLPRIKSLFIISHDLNWQDQSDSKNAIHILKRKLRAFPYVKTYVMTANHSKALKSNSNWFEINSEQNNLTFSASLVAGNAHDAFTQISISQDGNVTIQGVNLKR